MCDSLARGQRSVSMATTRVRAPHRADVVRPRPRIPPLFCCQISFYASTRGSFVCCSPLLFLTSATPLLRGCRLSVPPHCLSLPRVAVFFCFSSTRPSLHTRARALPSILHPLPCPRSTPHTTRACCTRHLSVSFSFTWFSLSSPSLLSALCALFASLYSLPSLFESLCLSHLVILRTCSKIRPTTKPIAETPPMRAQRFERSMSVAALRFVPARQRNCFACSSAHNLPIPSWHPCCCCCCCV